MLPAEAPRDRRRALLHLRALTAAAALALLAAGCGDEEGSDDAAPPAAAPELTVTLDPDGPGGRDAMRAVAGCTTEGPVCDELRELRVADFAPVDPATPCTEIYGGPDRATVSGNVADGPVEATLTRENGCEIERFERLVPLLTELFPGYRPGSAIGT